MKKTIISIVSVIAMFIVFGIAGNHEWADQVVYTMPQDTYTAVTSRLGKGASTLEIANEYIKNREHYDSLNVW